MAELIPFAACILIAFGIGSNDTSNSLGICIGAGIIKLKKAVLLFGFFVLIGIVLQGQKVMKTVGKDLLEVNPSMLSISLSISALFNIERILRALLLISGILIAYNTGANELATVLGPVIYSGLIGKLPSFFLGAFFVFLGAILLSSRVIETVGKGITALDPYSGFAAQLGAGSCVLLFTFLGMPISTTYCIIGGISGVGMVKGMKTVRVVLIKKMML